MQPLQRPAAAHVVVGQPVEQFGVRRTAAEGAEVGRRRDEPSAEVVQPDPVDQDSRDQRMLAAGQVDGVGQPTAGRGQRRVVGRDRRGAHHSGQYRELTRRDSLLGLPRITPVEEMRYRHLAGDLGQGCKGVLGRLVLLGLLRHGGKALGDRADSARRSYSETFPGSTLTRG